MFPRSRFAPWVVIGAGNQGSKHIDVLGSNCVAVIDTKNLSEGLNSLKKLSQSGARSVVIATPEHVKEAYVLEAVNFNMNIVVEKPMPMREELLVLLQQYISEGHFFLTAYDHLKDSLVSYTIEKVKNAREASPGWSSLALEYGFGTRNIIKNSTWMDFGSGPWELVSPHLIKLAITAGIFDNSDLKYEFGFGGLTSPTQVIAISGGNHFKSFKTSYTSWKNTFKLNYHFENGMIELDGLEKWGNASFRSYQMDFNRNLPVLLEERKSSLKRSYVEIFHKEILDVELSLSLDHDREIWRHIMFCRNALSDYFK